MPLSKKQSNMGPYNEASFWSRVDKSAGPNGCWLWTAAQNSQGYGQFADLEAHWYSFFLAYGKVPNMPGQDMVLQSCNNLLCVNPAHLYPGCQSSNAADMEDWRNCMGSVAILEKLKQSTSEMFASLKNNPNPDPKIFSRRFRDKANILNQQIEKLESRGLESRGLEYKYHVNRAIQRCLEVMKVMPPKEWFESFADIEEFRGEKEGDGSDQPNPI